MNVWVIVHLKNMNKWYCYSIIQGETVVSLRQVTYSLGTLSDSYYVHTNHYKHVENAHESSGLDGSKAREETARKMPVPTNLQDVCSILGDTSSPVEPIYRLPGQSFNRKSSITTVVSAVFDMKESLLRVYLNNPKYSKSPSLTLPFVCKRSNKTCNSFIW